MKRPPMRTAWYLRPLTWLLSAPDTYKHHAIIRRHGTARRTLQDGAAFGD